MDVKRLTRGPVIWVIAAVVILLVGARVFAPNQFRQIDTYRAIELIQQDRVQSAKIIDTGLTLSWLVNSLGSRGPASIEVATLLRKPEALAMPVEPKYVGWDIPNEFVVGYGLDYRERYRNLRDIGTLAPHVYS